MYRCMSMLHSNFSAKRVSLGTASCSSSSPLFQVVNQASAGEDTLFVALTVTVARSSTVKSISQVSHGHDGWEF